MAGRDDNELDAVMRAVAAAGMTAFAPEVPESPAFLPCGIEGEPLAAPATFLLRRRKARDDDRRLGERR